MLRLLLWLWLLSTLVRAADFRSADEAFNRGDFARAEQLYSELLRQDRARALEGLAAVYLSTGREFLAAVRESAVLRRALSPSGGPGLVREGGFERGLVPPWGTGHYESGNFNFGLWWNSSTCRSFAKQDSAVTHEGSASLRLTSFTPGGPHLFGTTAQRIQSIRPNTLYELSLWAKAESLQPAAFQVIVDAGWHMRPLTLPAGSYDWTRFKAQFDSRDLAFLDLRLLLQDTGTVWLDEVVLRPLDEGPDDPLLAVEDLYRRGLVREALQRLRALPPGPPVWTRQAEVLAAMGEYAQALELYEKLKTPSNFAGWLSAGEIHLQLGQAELARQHFQHVYERTPQDQARRAQAADGLAMACLRLGRLPEAAAWEGEYLRVMTHINDPHGRAHGLCHLARIHQAAGQTAAARDALESALPLALVTGDRKLYAELLTQRGSAADLAEAIHLQRQLYDRHGLVVSLYRQGVLQSQAGDHRGALASLEEAADLLETLKHASGSAAESLLKSHSDLYEELLRLRLQEGQPEAAWQVLSRSRGEELRRVFTGQNPALSARDRQAYASGQELLGERQALEDRLRQELSQPLSQARDKNLIEYRDFLRKLFESHPELAGLISVHPKQLRLKQAGLAADAAIVEYLCGQQQLYLFLVTSRRLEVKVLPVGREALIRRVAEWRRHLLGTSRGGEDLQLQRLSASLYQDLIGPIEPELRGVNRLGILPNGPLHYLPFQALLADPIKGQYLVDRMACVNLCEESFLSPPPSGPGPRRWLLLGNPDGTLPAAEEEVRAIAALFPGAHTFTGASARKELLLRTAGRYDGVHIASHGVLDSGDVTASYILLAAGRLTLREVWGLDMKGVELVTLSACRTGEGLGNAGDDLISLENAFFFAGARSVMASLWTVDDAATARLMTEFYRQLPRLGPARALQAAQQKVKREFPHPALWAPFILVGPSA